MTGHQRLQVDLLKNYEKNFYVERQAEISELELQSLRKQIVKESKRGQELSRQVSSLKEERNAIDTEYEQLKSREVSFTCKERMKN